MTPILSQLCVHGAFKIIKQLVTELFFRSLCIKSSLHSTPSSPPAVSEARGLRCRPLHPGRRGASPLRRRGRREPPSAEVSDLRRRRARRRQRLEGSTPLLSTAHPHCSGRNCNLWSEVREFHLLQNCIASWLNGSHYRCFCL